MIRRLWLLAAIATVAFASTRVPAAPAEAPVLQRVVDIPLPGPAVRFDYQTADTATNRLYLSHMNAGELLVFDVKARKVVGTVRDLPRVTGVWCVPSLGKVYASVPGDTLVAIIDTKTFAVEARIGNIGF